MKTLLIALFLTQFSVLSAQANTGIHADLFNILAEIKTERLGGPGNCAASTSYCTIETIDLTCTKDAKCVMTLLDVSNTERVIVIPVTDKNFQILFMAVKHAYDVGTGNLEKDHSTYKVDNSLSCTRVKYPLTYECY